MTPSTNWIRFAGLLHFYEIPAILFLPKSHDWETDLARLAPMNRKVISVLRNGIIIMVLGSGTVVMVAAKEIARGGLLPEALCCFLGIQWVYRGAMQVFIFGNNWPSGLIGSASYYGMLALFILMSAIYLCAFFSMTITSI